MDELRILSYTGMILLFVNTLLYLVSYAGKGTAYKIFVFYIILLFIIENSTIYTATQGINNHFLSTYYLIFQFTLLSSFFYILFKGQNENIQKSIKYVAVTVTAAIIAQYCLEPQLYYKFNPLGFLITTCIIVIYAVLYLYEMIAKKLPFFYVTLGIFVYLMSSSIIFASISSILKFNQKTSSFIFFINACLFVIYQLLILWEWKKSFYRIQEKRHQ